MTKPYAPARPDSSTPVPEDFDPFDGGDPSDRFTGAPPETQPDTAPDAPPSDAPDFAPVPRQRKCESGWTAERQRTFITTLADTGLVMEAAAEAGMTPRSAYQLRRAPGAESFAHAWEMAIAQATRQLTDIAFQRAIKGQPTPVFDKHGNMCGTNHKINDRLLMFLLRHHRRDIYGVGREKVLSIEKRAEAEEWQAGMSPMPEALDELVDNEKPVEVEQKCFDAFHSVLEKTAQEADEPDTDNMTANPTEKSENG